jgi:hypothetical protein
MSELFGIKIPQDPWVIVPCIILATVYVPNSKLVQSNTANYHLPENGRLGRAPGRQQALLH